MALIAAALFGIFALAHMAPFPFLLEAFRPAKSLWHVDAAAGTTPTIYFTFDDGPNPDWTPPLLDALREHGVRATFFLIDEHITADTAPIVRRMADEGHAIGLHSGTRRLMMTEPNALAKTLQEAASRIRSITAREPCRLFRPHAGWRSTTMYQALEQIDYRLAGWSWGMWDWDWWRGRHATRIAERLARKASAGDIVVIHDGHHKNPRADRRHAAETIRRLAPELQARGFAFDALCGMEAPLGAPADFSADLAARR
jgi:peptidoglycan/xylan/chitin deacetylase (PgdA/CDA1 family)